MSSRLSESENVKYECCGGLTFIGSGTPFLKRYHEQNMRIHNFICFLFLTIFFGNVCRAKDATIQLFINENNGGGLTNVWRVSFDRLNKTPLWHIGQEEPPLSLKKAITIAKAWIVSQDCSADSCVFEIVVRPVDPDGGMYQHICYYNILFGHVGLVGHYRRCIVLMDGTVVKPEWLGRAPKHDATYYRDE
jgi:hypothetical protein